MELTKHFEEILEKHYGEDECFYGFGNTERGYVTKSSYEDILTEMGLSFVEDASSTEYDSYGNTSIDHKVIFYHLNTETYYALIGEYQSYNGTDWEGFKEVTKKIKTLETWE